MRPPKREAVENRKRLIANHRLYSSRLRILLAGEQHLKSAAAPAWRCLR